MRIERTKNAKRNIVVGLINKAVVLLLPFMVRTAFIYSLGAEYLGLNSLFTAVLNVLNMTELGFSSAIVFSMYESIAKDDKDTICALLNFYRKIYKTIGVVIFVLGLGLIPFLPHLVNGKCPDELNIYLLYVTYLLNTTVSYLTFAYKKSILEAFQRKDIISWIEIITVGLTNIVQFILLITWHDIRVYYFYVLTLFVFTVLNNVVSSVIVDKRYPEYKCYGKLSEEMAQNIKKQVSGLMVSKVCQMTRNSFDSIFVSAFLGLTMTTIYNNYYYVLNAVVGLTTVFTGAITAGIGNSVATDSADKNYRDFEIFNFMYMWLAGWAAITMLCLYRTFMILWVGESLILSVGASVLFSLYFYVLKIGDIRATYSDAAGLWWENRHRAILEVVANIVLNFVFVNIWGVYGIIIATIIPIVCINNTIGMRILNTCYFKRKNSVWVFFKKNAIYFCATIIIGIFTYYICCFIQESIWGLFGKMAVCVMVPNFLYITFYYFNKDFQHTKKWLVQRLKRK